MFCPQGKRELDRTIFFALLATSLVAGCNRAETPQHQTNAPAAWAFATPDDHGLSAAPNALKKWIGHWVWDGSLLETAIGYSYEVFLAYDAEKQALVGLVYHVTDTPTMEDIEDLTILPPADDNTSTISFNIEHPRLFGFKIYSGKGQFKMEQVSSGGVTTTTLYYLLARGKWKMKKTRLWRLGGW